jgi:purine-binding chemotaxis protein CheW
MPEQPTSTAGSTAAPVVQPGKYMTFKLDGADYALPILLVREIIGRVEVTRVPRTREFIRGVANLRGKVIPVMDLRLRLGLERAAPREQSVVIVVDHAAGEHALLMGLLVDEVVEVLTLEAAALSPPPELGPTAAEAGAGGGFLLGVGQVESRVIFLLDLARVLTEVAP